MRKEFTGTAFIFNKERTKILLIFHKKLQWWLPPGGHMDANEYPHETALREVREETGLNVTLIPSWNDLKIVAPYEHQVPTPYCVLHEHIPAYKDKEAHIHIDFIYLTEADTMQLTINVNEVTDAQWFTKDEVLKLKTVESVFKICEKMLVQEIKPHQIPTNVLQQ